ncbi:delta-60 repeat domain protein [Cesiribacter andamanensis AMV16]|uniref:Delta-60 repeat domain protein n=2 Tax=Cesiribacter TaxID=1133570 RepID=M7N0U6_9BACT|nr:delta-60 repeat domain protein [Cesiribacter andamanensis AMV16]
MAGESFNGQTLDFVLARYLANGTLDPAFGSGGKVVTPFEQRNVRGKAIALQPDGKIVVAGHEHANRRAGFALARYLPDGSVDKNFGDSKTGTVITEFEGINDQGTSLALQENGKILVAGEAYRGGHLDFILARYNKNGKLDPSFGKDQAVKGLVLLDFNGADDRSGAIAVQPDGKIILAGHTVVDGREDIALARFDKDGSPDKDFGSQANGTVIVDLGGATEDLNRLLIEGDKLYAVGFSGASAASEAALIAAFHLTDQTEEPASLSVVATKNAAEDDQHGEFEIRLSRALATEQTIAISLSGSAQPGQDYEAPPTSVQLPAGEKAVKIPITVLADTEPEEEETVILTLTAPATEVLALDEAKKSATLSLQDNDKEEEQEPALLSVRVEKNIGKSEQEGFFEISLSRPLATDLSIQYSFSGTAGRGNQYTTEPEGESLVLKAGKDKEKIRIKRKGTVSGQDATIILSLKAPSAQDVKLDAGSATMTLAANEEEDHEDGDDGDGDDDEGDDDDGDDDDGDDDDDDGDDDDDDDDKEKDILISISNAKNAAEDDKDGEFELRISKELSTDLTIRFRLSGTATEGRDYSSPGSQVVLKAGQKRLSIPIQVLADTEVEGDETVVMELEAPAQQGIALDDKKSTDTLTIKDNDTEEDKDPSLLSVKVDAQAAEDDRDGAFIIRSSLPLLLDLTLSYTLGGTATEGTDYTSPGKQVVLKAGETSVKIPIAVKADEEVEGDETIILTLQPLTIAGALLDPDGKSATMILTDNDEEEETPEPALLSVQLGTAAAEDDQEGYFELRLSRPLEEESRIRYTYSGSAGRGTDYTTQPQGDELLLPAGQTSARIRILPIADEDVEGDETIVLSLQAPASAEISLDENKKTASMTLADNDEEEEADPALLSVQVAKHAAEDDQHGAFRISSSLPLPSDLTISFSLSGTATPGTDYTAPPSQLVLKGGQTSIELPITVLADEAVEGEETIVLTLLAPDLPGLVLDQARTAASMSLTDNDEEEEVTPALLAVTVEKHAQEDDQHGTFLIRSSLPLPADLILPYSLSGTATAGTDYTSPGNQVVLKAGETSTRVPINVLADGVVEEDETIILSLQAPPIAGALLDPDKSSATMTLTDNDEEEEEPVGEGPGGEPAPEYVVVPNLFSPNGDGMNDAFIVHARQLQSLHWRIYNRQGRLVYETSSVEEATQQGWDGTVGGKPQPEDSYMWILIYQHNAAGASGTKMTGSVTLIR